MATSRRRLGVERVGGGGLRRRRRGSSIASSSRISLGGRRLGRPGRPRDVLRLVDLVGQLRRRRLGDGVGGGVGRELGRRRRSPRTCGVGADGVGGAVEGGVAEAGRRGDRLDVVVEGGQARLVLAAQAGEQLVAAGDAARRTAAAPSCACCIARPMHAHRQAGQRLGQLARLVERRWRPDRRQRGQPQGSLEPWAQRAPQRRGPTRDVCRSTREVVQCPVPPRGARGRRAGPTYHGGMADQRGRVLLADPRGYCAGVDRAVVAVERALEIHGAPVYVRKQIVHNKHVVATLERRGRDLRRGDRRGARGLGRRLQRPRGLPGGARGGRRRGSCARSTRPARWSPRCTRRPSGSPATTSTSC